MDLIQALLVSFAIIALGIICERVKAFNHHHTEGLQLFLFKIGMPCYLFIATLHHDIASLIHMPYIACYLLSLFGVMTLVLSLFKKEGPSALCVKILASGYSNTAIYTLPIVTILLNAGHNCANNVCQHVDLSSSQGTVVVKKIIKGLWDPFDYHAHPWS